MNNHAEPPRRYQWPWLVLAAVVLGMVVAVVAVWIAAQKVERERDFSAPLPTSAPGR